MRVFVTGAGGSFARALLPALCAAPAIDAVTAVDMSAGRYTHPKLTASGIGFGDPEAAALLAGHDALVHLPPITTAAGAGPVESAEAAVRPAHKLFHAAHAAGVRRLVHVSSAAVYGAAVHASEASPMRPEAGFVYAERQAHLEQLLEIDFPGCVRLRPHLIVGPHAHPTLKRLLRQPFYPREPQPHPLFQCIHEDDLAQAILLSLQNDARGPYNIASEDSFSLRDAIRARHAFSLGLSGRAARKAFALGNRFLRLDLDAAWLERASHTLLVNCRRAIIDLGWRRRYTGRAALAAT